ncbi:pentatricopeptide repeat-containing protein At1g50270-like [Nicotiana tabacum]|uniref:Pentatricopeptide repeat-containing protein At1g50270-like n=1 Tax=Nicotiana tabacum TaxID=4097 RepID=A0A1S3X467_TOBAC|nr:PREDICTED: pentatricopeptide repeat-containing protein At1g50270-like [Nicotiana tabacum]
MTSKQYQQLNNITTKILNLLNKTCISPAHISQIQTQLILHNLHFNTTIAHNFISACQSLGLLNFAFTLYTKLIKKPHVFICNTLIQAFSQTEVKLKQKSISMYAHMHKERIFPNNYTYPFVLKSLSDLKELKLGQSVHTHIIKWGHACDIYVHNSLLNLYASCDKIDLCKQLFDEMPQRDVVSWTVMIMGYRDCGKYDDALVVFEQMRNAGVAPNRVTMVNALSACANYGALDMGMWIHDYIRRSGWELDVILGTSLIDMYGKCGKIEYSFWVFQEMKHKNVYTWNAVIRGLALAKIGEEAVQWFFIMERENVNPDEVTLVAVLCACAYSGMVEHGREIFSWLMNGKYGFPPGVKHYACMVVLLARCGHLEDAFRMIKEMPMEPTKSVWGALLAGCRLHGNQEMSEFAAWKLVGLAPKNSAYYVVLANLYGEMGRWNDAEKIRAMMKERGLSKDLGSSSVEVEDQKDLVELLR